LARGDLRANALLALPRALFALHPTARRLACEIRLARELAVDARVAGIAPEAYPRMLLDAAHHARFGAPPCAVAMHRSDLRQRLAALSDSAPRPPASVTATLALAGALTVLAFAAPRPCADCAARTREPPAAAPAKASCSAR
jgi:beta-lactamase regulating signal transducer with metallopeptidase domain